MTSQIRLLDA